MGRLPPAESARRAAWSSPPAARARLRADPATYTHGQTAGGSRCAGPLFSMARGSSDSAAGPLSPSELLQRNRLASQLVSAVCTEGYLPVGHSEMAAMLYGGRFSVLPSYSYRRLE